MVSDLDHSIKRARKRNREQSKLSADDENRFEQESRAFHQRVLDGFLNIARREPDRMAQIDARDPMAVVQQKILKLVEQRFFAPEKAKS